MRNSTSVKAIEREIRHRICARCARRTPGTDDWPLEKARACEEACSIFHHLPELKRLAMLTDPMIASPRHAVRRRVDEICGGACTRVERSDGQLTPAQEKYRDEVVDIILRMTNA